MKSRTNIHHILFGGLALVIIIVICMAVVSGEKTLASNNVAWQLSSTGLPDSGNPMAVAFGDSNNDGKLDILSGSILSGLNLWTNDGTPAWGDETLLADSDQVHGIETGDFNQDGRMDVVASVGGRVHVYTQDNFGEWTDVIPLDNTGAFYQVAVGDINNDGLLDLMILDMLPWSNERQKTMMGAMNYDKYHTIISNGYAHQYMRNTLQLNLGMSNYSEIGRFAGIQATDWSWTPLFADFDHDGLTDLFISNGYYKDITDKDYINYSTNLGNSDSSCSKYCSNEY